MNASAVSVPAERLTEFMGARGVEVVTTEWRVLAGGRAAETVLVALEVEGREEQWVVRLEPEQGPTHGIALSTQQHFELLQALSAVDVAAPDPVVMSRHSDTFGRPFMITKYSPGDVPSPWSARGRALIGSEPARTTLPASYARTLATIHATPLDALPASLPRMTRPNPFLAETDRWTGLVARSRFARDPLLEFAGLWLNQHPINSGRRGLVHGDYRLGNLVLDQGNITGVLDWEMATIGDPLMDLGLLCSPPVLADWRSAGLGSVNEVIDHYEECTGTVVARSDLRTLTVLSTLKIVALWINGADGLSSDDPNPDALRAALSALEARPMLAEALGLSETKDLAAMDSARSMWIAELKAELKSMRSAVEPDRSRLKQLLAHSPEPDHMIVDWFQTRLNVLAKSMSVERENLDVAAQLSLMTHRLLADPDSVDSNDRVALEQLVAASAHVDVTVLPW